VTHTTATLIFFIATVIITITQVSLTDTIIGIVTADTSIAWTCCK
jgi:hypothetical protein